MPEDSQASQGAVQAPESQKAKPRKRSSPARMRHRDFSPDGLSKFEEETEAYIVELEQASEAVAKRRKSEQITAYDVELAADLLFTDKRGKVERIREFGILLIGAGLGYLGTVIFGSSYTFKNALIAFIPLLLGSIAYAYSWGQSR